MVWPVMMVAGLFFSLITEMPKYYAIFQILVPDDPEHPTRKFYYDRFRYRVPSNDAPLLLGFAKKLRGDFDDSQIELLESEVRKRYE